MSNVSGDKKLCIGCRDDFYNQPGNSTTGECWRLKDAKAVRRYRIPWWTEPTVSGAFVEVVTNSCHSEPGRFGFYETLPSFAVATRLLPEEAR